MKWILIALVLLCSCSDQDSEMTTCPCEVVEVEVIRRDIYEITVRGRGGEESDTYTHDFTFRTRELKKIGDIIK